MKKIVIIIFLLVLTSVVINMASAGEKILYSKVKTIEPGEVNGQYCFVKVIIKQEGENIVKEEVLECADGKKVLKHQVIGSYLLNFITVMYLLQNIADTIVGQITSLNHQEKRV